MTSISACNPPRALRIGAVLLSLASCGTPEESFLPEYAAIDLLNSGPCTIGQDGVEKQRVGYRSSDDDMDAPQPLITGPQQVPIDSDWEGGARVLVQVDPYVPLPCMIRSITPVYDAEP